MALTIDFEPVLDAADLMRRADRDLRKEMNKRVRQRAVPWLRAQITRNASTSTERKLAGTARIRGGQRPGVIVGGGKKFSGGATASMIVAPIEFGSYAPYTKYVYSRRSPRGTAHSVKRATKVQLGYRESGGRFIYPAVKEVAPALVSMWVGHIYQAYIEAASGR